MRLLSVTAMRWRPQAGALSTNKMNKISGHPTRVPTAGLLTSPHTHTPHIHTHPRARVSSLHAHRLSSGGTLTIVALRPGAEEVPPSLVVLGRSAHVGTGGDPTIHTHLTGAVRQTRIHMQTRDIPIVTMPPRLLIGVFRE